MKKCLLLFLTIFIFGCSSNNINNPNCNFLLDIGINFNLTTSSGPGAQLLNPGNAIKINGVGNGGIIVIRTGSETLRAWDAADPNVPLSSCSILEINGLNAISSCTNSNEYSLFTGQVVGQNAQPCTLLPYRIELVGNNQYLISN